MAASIVGKENFLEIYVSTPIEECERRDVKGLYAKARRGEIKDFTGVSAPFEAPEHPDLTLDTSVLSLEESVTRLLELILPKVSLGGNNSFPGMKFLFLQHANIVSWAWNYIRIER